MSKTMTAVGCEGLRSSLNHPKAVIFIGGIMNNRIPWNKGLHVYCGGKRFEIGSIPKNYKGDEASYSAKHKWVIYHYGKANKCESYLCDCPNPKRYEWSNISGEHKRVRSDWIMLCPSCHRKKDFGSYCKKGHPLSGVNLRIKKRTRICRICDNEYRRKIYANN